MRKPSRALTSRLSSQTGIGRLSGSSRCFVDGQGHCSCRYSRSIGSYNQILSKLRQAALSPKIRPLFDIMSDGNAHSKLTVARRLGYDMDKLSGFEKEIGSMVKKGYLTRDGDMIQLTDKCFPFGRADGALSAPWHSTGRRGLYVESFQKYLTRITITHYRSRGTWHRLRIKDRFHPIERLFLSVRQNWSAIR